MKTATRDGLSAQARALAEGEISSLELVEQSLRRIGETQSTLNAFRVVRGDAALAEAKDADRELSSGGWAPRRAKAT